LEIELKSQTKS